MAGYLAGIGFADGSREQSAELLLLSYVDIALIVGIPLVIVLEFFLLGRPNWMRVLRYPSKYQETVNPNPSRDLSLKH